MNSGVPVCFSFIIAPTRVDKNFVGKHTRFGLELEDF